MKKSLIIDQSWTSDWVTGPPTVQERRDYDAKIRALPAALHELALRFPLFAVVSARVPGALEVPYLHTLAILDGYELHPEHGVRFAIRQSPDASPVWVAMHDVQLQRFWKGVGSLEIAQIFGLRSVEAVQR